MLAFITLKHLLAHLFRFVFIYFSFSLPVIAVVVPAEILPVPELIRALQSGGHIIYMRHGATNISQLYNEKPRLDDCSTQRNLNVVGRFEVQEIGNKIKALGIPVGGGFIESILSMYRYRKTGFWKNENRT